MKLLRKEAARLISFYQLLNLSEEEMAKHAEDVKSESSLDDDVALEKLHYHIRKSIEYRFKFYTTSYLTTTLSGHLQTSIEIIGLPPPIIYLPVLRLQHFDNG